MNLIYKALADPTRRKILELLRERDMTAGEIAEHFSTTKPTLSRHFAILREANLIRGDKDGRKIIYRLNAPVLEDALLALMDSYDFVWKPPIGITTLASEVVRLLAEEDFVAATANFDSRMQAALPPEKLEESWKTVIAEWGPFVKQCGTRTEQGWPYTAVFVACEFAKSNAEIKVVFHRSGKISGLWISPAQ